MQLLEMRLKPFESPEQHQQHQQAAQQQWQQ